MRCAKFESALCRSCTELATPYAEQLARKDAACRALLGAYAGVEWLPPVASAERAFRNKAKMVVGGTADAPLLGIPGVDLSDCPLYPDAMQRAFAPIKAFIALARIEPYDVALRRGELKFVLLTHAGHSGRLLLRFVLRSTEPLARIGKHLDALRAALPELEVVSVNVQPEHKAVLEGDREIVLTQADTLTMRLNGIPLHLAPKSFFQTNDAVAAALYAQARDWARERAPGSVWDLYCGVGGFALHCAGLAREVVGVEASVEAIASATRSAAELGATNVRFVAGDALEFARAQPEAADLVIVNPPRRGIGAQLAALLERSAARTVIYSSCNAESLARDLAAMPGFALRRARVMDMFPHTAHYEVLALLTR